MMMSEERVTIGILLAGYNGEKYIGNQLDSLLAQTYTDWKLFIRDDGSTDQTVSIINKYRARDNRICLLHNSEKNLGSCQNFATLLSISRNQFQYIMFCDQDDFWLPFKIEETLTHMRDVEAHYGKETPLLVYTNFQYVDDHLKVIESKKKFNSTKVSKLRFANLLAQNPAYGCTMMLNKQLAAIAGVIPLQAENHDYWIALVASALGEIAYLNKRTILYRQHNSNISTNYNSSSFIKRFKRILLQRKNFEDAEQKLHMALAFKSLYYDRLTQSHKRILDEFINFATRTSFSRLVRNIRNGVRRQTLSQTFLFYASMMLLKKKQ
jgi:rhamnosyltransferase